MSQHRWAVKLSGGLCIVGGCLAVAGSFLPWYDPVPAAEFLSNAPTVDVDLYQIPHDSGSRAAIVIGAVALLLLGLVASGSPRRLPVHWGVGAIVASFVVMAAVLAVEPPMAWEGVLSLPPPRGPGVAIALTGSGLGLLAVVTQFACWIRVKWSEPTGYSPARTASLE